MLFINWFLRVIAFSVIILILIYPCQTFKFTQQPRQTNYCHNHAMGDFVANPLNCKEFYWCGKNGESVPASCPSNMLFNAVKNLCDAPDKVKCQASASASASASTEQTAQPLTTSSRPAHDPLAEATQFCANLVQEEPNSNALVYIANPKECSQYFMCYYGEALLQECSSNLLWNSKIGKCDLPSNANCMPPSDDATSIQISPPIENPTGQEYTCPLYGQHIFPHMERCDFFIYCIKGYGTLQKCPFFHWFDIESGSCKWRTRALCVKDLNLKFRKKKTIFNYEIK